MLKRKVLAGGYQDSSDDESGLDGLKRPKSVPYAPPRLTASSRSSSGKFHLPGSAGSWTRISTPSSRQVSLSSSSNRATPVPEIQIGSFLDPKSRGSTAEPSSASSSMIPNAAIKPTLGAYRTSNARSSLALEHQINELTGNIEEYKSTTEQRQKATDNTLALILESLNRLESVQHTPTTSQALADCHSTPSAVSNVKTVLSNPIPTPELIATISKVVTEARSRVGKKKGGADDNSCKEHARTTFYRMLEIAAAREVRPYFEDEYGEPDTLPAQFIDPDTGYCRPYPHWKAALTKQAAWVPTFILRFRSTIPNDRSELSNVLRGLSDEAITILLHDGPFKSATTAWRDAKKSDVEVEAMRSNARRYQRCNRKAAVRSGYIKAILSLQGSDWEYLSHPGYMSLDESDDEGKLITKRSVIRAQWETNLYDAIFVAERVKAMSKPRLCPRLHHRSVEPVKRPIPHLERGTGSGKVTVRVAICGISNNWRQQNPDELRKYSHLLNMRVLAKPDISLFLKKHPLSSIDGDDENDGGESGWYNGELAHAAVKVEESPLGDEDPIGAGGNEANELAKWYSLNYDGDEESGAILEMGGILSGHGAVDMTDKSEVEGPPEEGSIAHIAEFQIDPQLITDDIGSSSDQPGVRPTLPNSGIPPPFYSSEMPPPPLLIFEPEADTSDAAISNNSQAKGKGKKTQVKRSGSGVVNSEGDSLSNGAVLPKRRGRPPGSKNKPKP